MASIASYSAQLQNLIKEIHQNDIGKDKTDEVLESMLQLVEKVQPATINKPENKSDRALLESSAVSLWNLAVARKTQGLYSAHTNARYCDNPGMAESSLLLATECLEKLRKLLVDRIGGGGETSANKKRKLEVEKDMFKVLAYRAEASCAQGQQEEALNLIKTAKEMLHVLPKEGGFLSMLAYNFGVDCYRREQYEHSITWLRESFQTGKDQTSVGGKNQARTLRLLANAYLDWDAEQYWQKALNAVGLANAEHLHPAGLYLKVKILLLGETQDDRLKSALEDVYRHVDLSIELGLNAIKLLIQHKKPSLAVDGFKQLEQRYKHTPELGKIYAQHLEMLLLERETEEAKMLVEECIQDHHTGQPLDMGVRKTFHVMIWEQAAVAFESKDFPASLEWYNFSLSLFGPNERNDKNVSKLHRNRASCYIGMQNYEKAKSAMDEAEICESKSPFTSFLTFKVALLQGNDEKAIEALVKMSEEISAMKDMDAVQGLICLAAQISFEKSNQNIAVRALESLVAHSSHIQQVMTALRCLTRLRLSFLAKEDKNRKDVTAVISYLKTAYSKLDDLNQKIQLGNMKEVEGDTRTMLNSEATWFMKIAWNLSLQCNDSSSDMHDLFLLCSKFGQLCIIDMANLVRQKTCMLMAAAAGLQMARETKDLAEKRVSLKMVLDYIQDCRDICDKITENRIRDTGTKSKDSTAVLLILYEFEAKAGLGEEDLDTVLAKALALPNSDSKTFETIAALSMEPPSENRSISIRALKVAVKKHIQSDPINYNKLSKIFHSLIQLSLQCGLSVDPNSIEEAYSYFVEVQDLISNKARQEYPEMEVLWLMTKAWNCGIHLYSAGKFTDAERWCSLSMGLLKHLTSMKLGYETQMTTVYAEVLARIDSGKAKGRFEE
ncbi:testis-expressed protein 11-like isoform X2 [Lineus longissimus]|uniref:testis-expressed protein 11-like isoform X2 n=1 Tax=Lineus longissimus TaxID=88925 RepID=UPI00315D319C